MSSSMNYGDLAAYISIGFIVIVSVINLIPSKSSKKTSEEKKSPEKPQVTRTEAKSTTETPKISWRVRLNKGLSKTRNDVWGRIENVFSSNKLDEEAIDHIEELLFTSDMSAHIVDELVETYKKQANKENANLSNFKAWTYDFLNEKLSPIQNKRDDALFKFTPNSELKVFMIVGVNGAGKTTSIGKLATKLKNQGAKVVVGACDTFRAAAVEQLEVWCNRAGVEMVKAKSGSDPSGVGYAALEKAIAEGADYCLLDTAGRLHTKQNLMDELGKSKRVLSKLDPKAPHQVLLVVDSITGQNAIAQAQEFNKALDLSGIILTKCDGSSKAGNAISIVDKLNVPITYIGVGEDVEDLEVFQTNEYLTALLGLEGSPQV